MTSVGEILRNSRLSKEWTPEAASRVTKIRVPQLLALERNDYSKFAAPAYARGFVRIYARCLGLDEKAILSQLDGTYEGDDDDMFVHAPPVDYVPERIRLPLGSPTSDMGWKILVGGFLLFLIITGIVIGYWLQATPAALSNLWSGPGTGSPSTTRAPSTATTPAAPSPGASSVTQRPGPGSAAARPGSGPGAAPSISTVPEVPTAPRATAVVPTPGLDMSAPAVTPVTPGATPPAPGDIPVAPIAAPVTPGDIPTAPPVVETPGAPAPAPTAPGAAPAPAGGEPHRLRITARGNGVRITMSRTTRAGVVKENHTLNNGQSQEYTGSFFSFDTSAPNLTSWGWDGEDRGIIDPSTTTPMGYDMPPPN